MIVWNNKKIPFLYIFIYKLIKEKSGNNLSVSYKTLRELFRRRFNKIPHLYYTIILDEMEFFGLLKKIGNKKNLIYELLGKDADKLLNNFIEPLAG